MKTKEIEIYDVQKVKEGYLVEYSTETSEVDLTIPNEKLIEFIVDNEMNTMSNWNNEISQYEDVTFNPETCLSDNYFSIVSQYLEDLHKC